MITLKTMDTDDYSFLYELLKERPKEANISHSGNLPSFEEHCKFCDSRPYKVWYIILRCDPPGERAVTIRKVGSIYKTYLGEIGIFIMKKYHREGIARNAIPLIYDKGNKRNLANVAPNNIGSHKLFKKLGFKCIQYTYQLKKGECCG